MGNDGPATQDDRPPAAPTAVAAGRPSVRERRSLHLPLLLGVALACLIAGLTLPIMEVRNFWLFGGSYSILGAIVLLINEGEVLTGAILLAFSVCLPVAKIMALLATWWRLRAGGRPAPWLPRLLEAIGKWSMLDVLVVALVIFAAKAGALVDASVAGAVVPFIISIALTLYCARRITGQITARG